MKTLLLVLAALSLAVALAAPGRNATAKLSGVKNARNFMGVKELDLKNLEGRWHELGSSSALHKAFTGGCMCPTVTYKVLDENKIGVVAGCMNMTSGKEVQIKGTLTQVMPEQNPGAFQLEFIEKKGTGLPIKVNKTEQQEVASKFGEKMKTGIRKLSEGAMKGVEEVETKRKSLLDEFNFAKDDNAAPNFNTVVLKIDRSGKYMLLGAPKIGAVWLLGRSAQIDEELYDKFVGFAQSHGYSAKIKKADLGKCTGKQQKVRPLREHENVDIIDNE